MNNKDSHKTINFEKISKIQVSVEENSSFC